MSNVTDPKNFNNPDRTTLVGDDVASLGLALISLTKELWVVRDRLAVLEAVLEEKGIDVSDSIDQYQPDDEMQEKLEKLSNTLVENILGALNGRDT